MLSSSSESSELIYDPGISSKQASTFRIASNGSVPSRFLRSTSLYTGHVLYTSFHLVTLCMPQEPIPSYTS